MYCIRCQTVLFQDEGFELVQVINEGTWSVCPRCAASMVGEPPPARKVYTQFKKNPPPGISICGVCRMALRHGEDVFKFIRLAHEDVEGTDVKPGGYTVCEACKAHWAPIIYARLQAAHTPGLPPLLSLTPEGFLG